MFPQHGTGSGAAPLRATGPPRAARAPPLKLLRLGLDVGRLLGVVLVEQVVEQGVGLLLLGAVLLLLGLQGPCRRPRAPGASPRPSWREKAGWESRWACEGQEGGERGAGGDEEEGEQAGWDSLSGAGGFRVKSEPAVPLWD